MGLEPGTVIGSYVVEEKLGEGGMAVVWRIRQRDLSTRYALKLLTIHNKRIQERLLQEGQLQGRLRHPHIVGAIGTLDYNGSLGLIMEFIEGPSLDHWLYNYRPTLDEALELFRGIVSGVGAAHLQGMIHRDLKPGNILLLVEERGLTPKVTDFGLAKAVDRQSKQRTRTGTTMGTPTYMAPEQIRDASRVDRRADLYSLGAILFELVTGRKAFEDDDVIELFVKVASGDRPRASSLVEDLPEWIDELIEALMTVDPTHRIADCATVLAVLDSQDPEQLHETHEMGADAALPPLRPLPSDRVVTLPPGSPGMDIARRFVTDLVSVPPLVAVDPHAPTVLSQPTTPPVDSTPFLIGVAGALLLLGGLVLIGVVVSAGGAGALLATWAVDPSQPVEVTVTEPAPAPTTPEPVVEHPVDPAPLVEPSPVQPVAVPDPVPPSPPVPPPDAVAAEPVVVEKPVPARKSPARYSVVPGAGVANVFVSNPPQSFRPGRDVPPGSYTIIVDWPERGLTGQVAGKLVLAAGERAVVECFPSRAACRKKK